jgi:hypothetical protein
MLALATAVPSGATPPGMKGPPSHDVTGCVRGTDLLLAAPQGVSGMGAPERVRIVPCVDTPLDFSRLNGKLIRARGELDRQNEAFVCPRDIIVLGDCPKGYGAPPPSSDSTPCGTIDSGAVTVPEDFEISCVSGPAHADWGGRKALAVTAKGEVTEKEGKPGRPAPGEARMERVTTYRISPNRVKQIYGQVLACNFFELNTHYAASGIMDGSTESLRVRAGGREHSVSVSNTHVERFSRIVAVLISASAPAANEAKENRKTSK